MRRFLRLALSLTLLLPACKKESPVEPDDTGPPPNAVVIGPSGGSVSCEGFSVLVPAGTFTRAETLAVQQEQYDGMLGASSITGLFRLDGLPSSYEGQIRVRLKSAGVVSGSPALHVGRRAYDIETREPTTWYWSVPATLDSGHVTASLSQAGMLGKIGRVAGGGIDAVRWFITINEIDSLTSTGKHFKVFFPRYAEGMATLFAKDLEDAYTAFEAIGMNRMVYSRAAWPFGVRIVDFRAGAESYVLALLFNKNQGATESPALGFYCDGSKAVLANATQYRGALFTEFSNLFPYTIDPYYQDRFFEPTSQPRLHGERLWLYHAFARWASARLVAGYATPWPPSLAGRTLTPLKGMPLEPFAYSLDHGCGMTGLVKHIADTYGETALVDLYFAIPDARTAVDVLLEKLPEPENVWWPAFMRRYLSGEIYGVQADTLLREMETEPEKREFTVAGKADTLKYFTAQYRDLSAKLFRVNLRYPGISSNATISFSIDPRGVNLNYVDVIVFGLKDHKLEYWGMGDAFTVTKLKDRTAAGYDIVAAVVNSANESPYNGTMSIELDVKVTGEVLTLARIKARTAGVIRFNDGSSAPTSLVLYNADQTFRQGTLVNGIFRASWDTTTSVRNSGSWTVQVDFSQTPSRVTYFKAEETTISFDTETWRLESSPTCDITGGKDQYGRYFYRVQGPDVAKHLLPVYNRLDGTFGYWRELTSTSFDSESYIEIILE